MVIGCYFAFPVFFAFFRSPLIFLLHIFFFVLLRLLCSGAGDLRLERYLLIFCLVCSFVRVFLLFDLTGMVCNFIKFSRSVAISDQEFTFL